MKHVIATIILTILFPQSSMAYVQITKIIVTGNHRTDPDIIRNYLYLREGDAISREELADRISRSERRLLDTRYFSSASVTTTYEDGEKVTVHVMVQEGFLWRFTAGTWFVQLGRDNLFGKGVNGSLYLSTKTQSLILDNPYFRGTPFLVRMRVNHLLASRDIVFVEPEEGFDYRRIGASFSIGYNFNPDLSIAFIAGVHTFNLEEKEFGTDALSFLNDNGICGRTKDTDLGASFLLDRRDNRLTPFDGYLFQGSIVFRDGAPGILFQALDYKRTGKRTYIFSRLSLTNFGNKLPYHLWQGLGGVWGLKFPNSGDLIGRSTVLASIEPRYRFLEIPFHDAFLEARIFLDAGAATLRVSELSFDRLISGYGAGLRLWIGYPYFQNAVAYYGIRRGEGEFFFRFGSSF